MRRPITLRLLAPAGLLLAGLFVWFTLTAQDRALAQPTCDISWSNPAGGDWHTTTNWDKSRIPAATDNVCITLNGNYEVSLNQHATVAGLALQTTIGTPALQVIGADLTVSGAVSNDETIRTLPNVGRIYVHSSLIISGTLTNRGRLEIRSGYGSDITGNLINEPTGTLEVRDGVAFHMPSGVITNRGTINIPTGGNMTIDGAGQTFNQESGTITVDGTFNITKAAFNFNGGSIAGVPTLTDVQLSLGPASGPVQLKLQGANTTLNSNVRPGQVLRLDDVTTINGSLSNAGTIEMRGNTLVVNNGVLTNATGGTLDVVERAGRDNNLDGSLDNRGTLRLRVGLNVRRTAAYTNTGNITIEPNAPLQLTGAGPLFTQAGGTINNAGSFTMQSGAFNFSGGSLSGTALALNNLSLKLGAGAGAGNFTLGGQSSIEGNINNRQSVMLAYGSKITVNGDLSNAGTLDMDFTTLLVNGGTLTNEAGATIYNRHPGTNIFGSFINRGTFAIEQTLRLGDPGGIFTNAGHIELSANQYLSVAGGAFVNLAGGTVGGAEGRIEVAQNANLSGEGTLATNLVNNGTLSPGASTIATGSLRIGGTYSQGGTGRLNIQLGGTTAGSSYDQLVVDGEASLGGTLALSLLSGYTPATGDSFNVLSFATLKQNTKFAATNGLFPAGVKLRADLGATGLTVVTTQGGSGGTAAPPWLVLLYLAGDDVAPSAQGQSGLAEPMRGLLRRLAAMPVNPAMRLVVLYDGDQKNDSRIYLREAQELKDVTELAATSSLWVGGFPGDPNARELNTGSVTTLRNFLSWARTTYPGSRYTFLSIVDHGGGWAPDLDPPAQPRSGARVQAGGWRGMSLDMASGGSSLSTRGIGEALRGEKLDLLFFDACLMGMLENAYEVRDSADYLVAGENLLFADLPYERYLAPAGLTSTTTPRDMAIRLVEQYNSGTRTGRNPFAIAALDLRQLRSDVPANLALRLNTLAERLLANLPDPVTADNPLFQALTTVYSATQKFDYDSSLSLNEREGYVDLADFATRLSGAGAEVPADVRAAAAAVAAAVNDPLAPVVVKLRVVSGEFDGKLWKLDGAQGLSIFLPLGEQDYRPTQVDASKPEQPAWAERQLKYYADPAQLALTSGAPKWAELLVRLEPAVGRIRTGKGGLPAGSALSAPFIDTTDFNSPFPVAPVRAAYLPLVLR